MMPAEERRRAGIADTSFGSLGIEPMSTGG
jgi:hypothetical protein